MEKQYINYMHFDEVVIMQLKLGGEEKRGKYNKIKSLTVTQRVKEYNLKLTNQIVGQARRSGTKGITKGNNIKVTKRTKIQTLNTKRNLKKNSTKKQNLIWGCLHETHLKGGRNG